MSTSLISPVHTTPTRNTAGLDRKLLLAQKEADAAVASARDTRIAAEKAGRRHAEETAHLVAQLAAANCVINAMRDLVSQAQLEAKIDGNGFIPAVAVADLAELLVTRSAR